MRYVNQELYDKESILIPRKGSLNNIFFVNEPFWTVDTLFWTQIDKSVADPRFLFYRLGQEDMTILNVGSAVPSLTVPVLEQIELELPSLREQKAIASVLYSLDAKIDLLHRQNKTLEAMAEALFRQWFVEEAEEGWKEHSVTSICELVMGQSPKGDTYNETGDGLLLLNGAGDFENGLPKPQRYTSDPLRVAKNGDIILSIRGTIGNLTFATQSYAIGRSMAALRPKDVVHKYVVYLLMKRQIDELRVQAFGSVIVGLTIDDFDKVTIKLPPVEQLREFVAPIEAVLKKRAANWEQIRALTALRDTLLPKLMSGEVRVEMT